MLKLNFSLIAAGILVIALHLVFLLLFRVDYGLVSEVSQEPKKVSFLGGRSDQWGEHYGNELLLNDSAPLFIPTPWNSASNLSELASLKEAVETFQPFPPDLLVPFEPLPAIRNASQNLNPENLLVNEPAFFLSRFGTIQPVQMPNMDFNLPKATFLNVNELSAVPVDIPLSLLESDRIPSGLWQPVVGYLQLFGGRPLGPPLLGKRSGYPTWDLYLLDYLLDSGTYNELKDGYYKFVVEP
jgi:hypothetical protein